MRRVSVNAVLGLLLLASACGGGGPDRARTEAASDEPARCDPAIGAPAGFALVESFEDPYPDHIGVRLAFRDGDGRELHYFVGIPGEFGEGLPVVGQVDVALGLRGSLLGAGGTWVLAWDAPGPCGAHAALGTGFTREEFLQALREAGAIPAA